MQRRDFLRQSLLGVAALALPGWLQAGEGFAAALRRYPWLIGWQDARHADGIERSAQLQGRLPDGLRGSLYRNGPGRFTRGGQRYRHWFDGDGLIQRWRLGDDGVSHRARFAATPKFQREEQLGRFALPAAGTFIADADPIRNSDSMNTANTAVMLHDGELYALWEGGSAFALDREDLASRGFQPWREDLASVPFSAHPLHEADGRLWNFGLANEQLILWQLGADGAVRDIRSIGLPFAGYLHAFSMSERYLAFVLMPYLREGDVNASSLFESLRWRPQRGCRALVVDKADLDRQRWYGLPAGAAYHFGPAREEAGRLLLTACWSEDGAALRSPMAAEMRGEPAPVDAGSQLLEIGLDLRGGGVDLQTLARGSIDFPAWSARGDGRRWHAVAGVGGREHGYFDAVCSYTRAQGEVDRYDFGDGVLVEEHRFVQATAARRPEQGWLVGTLLDYRRQRSGLAVLDAENLAAGPQALAWLPHALPLGFHGCFAAA